jgi:hypothetical protein
MSNNGKNKNLAVVIIWSGLLVGTLDIVAACLNTWIPYHIGPAIVLKFIASGLLGKAAFTGGNDMAAYGMIIHFLITYAFTWFFFAIYPRLKLASFNWVLTGIIYGVLIWVVMNLVVVPITLIPKGHFKLTQIAIGAGILVLLIGLPLSYIAKQYYARVKA